MDLSEIFSTELLSATPETTVGKALNTLREGRIAHLQIVEDSELQGMPSLFDVIEFTTRGGSKSQGGSWEEFGVAGGYSRSAGGGRGGFGAREGDSDRMLDVPVRDLMSDLVATVRQATPLDEVFETMFEQEISSLVVTTGDTDQPLGIITKTDVIDALTWESDDRDAVQVFGLDLLKGMD